MSDRALGISRGGSRSSGPKGRCTPSTCSSRCSILTRKAVAARKLANVEYVLASDNSPRLPERSVDLVFIAYAYHEFGDPDAMMAGIRRALRPGADRHSSSMPKRAKLRRRHRSQDELRGNPPRDRAEGFGRRSAAGFPARSTARRRLHNKVAERFDRKSGRPTYPCGDLCLS